MRLAGRLFASASALLVALAAIVAILAVHELRHRLTDALVQSLTSEARLVAAALGPDSLAWSTTAASFASATGHHVALLDSTGRARGDTAGRGRPTPVPGDVRAALETGAGSGLIPHPLEHDELAVSVRGGRRPVAVVRITAPLDGVDTAVAVVAWRIVAATLVAVACVALWALLLADAIARPFHDLANAARAIGRGEHPVLPPSRIPELATDLLALHATHEELAQRITELGREREETQTLIESMADGVLATDAHGTIVTVNTAARRFLGYRQPGQPPPLSELFHDKRARDLVRAALNGQEIDQRELELEGRALLVTTRTLPNGGALLVLRDVSTLRRLEAVRRDFVANVSHELKTPLTSIVGYAETLVTEVGEHPQARRFAETILSNAQRMQRLVDDLLDLSRIESGVWQPTPRLVDLAGLAREAWAPFADRAQGQEVAFALDVAPAAATVAVDPEALRQVFTNLFDNALRHTGRGGTITVGAREGAEGIQVRVRDTGAGIPPEHLPRIFERFYRADAGRARAQGGTGLGLAIVKHLVEAHGGRVAATSGLGEGTTVELYFPGDGLLS